MKRLFPLLFLFLLLASSASAQTTQSYPAFIGGQTPVPPTGAELLGAVSGSTTNQVTSMQLANVTSAVVTQAPYNASGFIAQTVTAPTPASGTATQSGTTLTVVTATGGNLGIGSQVSITGSSFEVITALVSGTGGTGTYTVSVSQTVGSATAFTSTAVIQAAQTVIPVASTTGFATGDVVIISLAGTSGTKNFAGFISSISAGVSITISATAVTGASLPATSTSGTSGITTAVPAGYIVYSLDSTTLGSSVSNGATSLPLTNAASYQIGQGILVTGGATSAANLVTKITGIASNTVTISPAISNASGVASGVNVQHDDTAAFQSAVNLASYNRSVKIFVPDGYYQINGPAQANSSASVALPSIDYYDGPGGALKFWNAQATIEMTGNQPAPQIQSYLANATIPHENGAIIQSSLSNGGSIFGAYDLNGDKNFTNILFVVRNLTFRTYPNPNITPLNYNYIESMQVWNFDIDTGDTGPTTQPTHTNIYGIIGPQGQNGGNHTASYGEIMGYYNGIVLNEHSRLEHIRFDNDFWPVTINNNGFYGVSAVEIEFNGCPHGLTGQNRVINFEMLNIEHETSPGWTSNVDDINDTSNSLLGFVSVDNHSSGINITDATSLHVVNMNSPAFPLDTQTFSALSNSHYTGAPNGTMLYCSDCTIASTCAGSGTGAMAKMLNGVWVCN